MIFTLTVSILDRGGVCLKRDTIIELEETTMFKYCFEGDVREADGPEEAFAACNLLPPEPEDPARYFLVRVLMWHQPDKDYTVEKIDGCGYRLFSEYDEAMRYFRFVETSDALKPSDDAKLQLVHYTHGEPKIVHSKMILRTALIQEP